MQKRLQLLQERMKIQQVQDNEILHKTNSGNAIRWNSSNLDKGSITNYGKEIHDKYKDRNIVNGVLVDPLSKSNMNTNNVSSMNSSRKLQQVQQQSKGNFKTKGTNVFISCCIYVLLYIIIDNNYFIHNSFKNYNDK